MARPTCDDKDLATLEDQCKQGSCAGKPVTVTFLEIQSDQFPGDKANYLPGSAGQVGNAHKYILMGARADGSAYFRSKLAVTPDTSEARSRVKVGVAEGNSIKSQGSYMGTDAAGSVSTGFNVSVTDYQLVAGVDKDGNGNLDSPEIMATHASLGSFRLVPRLVYATNQVLMSAGASVFGLPLVFPNAGNLLSGFASGGSPSTAVVTSDNVTTANPSLSHAVGAFWNNSGRASINKYTFGQNTSFADDIDLDP